jgi:16S rRNA (cytosine967-C5)-methyltransferase
MSESRCWKRYHYPRLLHMWRDWLNQDRWQPVDLWLREWQRKHPYFPPGTKEDAKSPYRKARGSAYPPQNKRVHSDEVREERLIVSEAMFQAMRFLQLASALETAYQRDLHGESALGEVDWRDWDSRWQPADAENLAPEVFWYWVGLRLDTNCPAPNALPDATKRQAWFAGIEQHFSNDENANTWLLWHGLRPQWLPDFGLRQKLSNWSVPEFANFISEQNYFPPLWLRAQGGKSLDELARQLTKEGVKTSRAAAPVEGLNATGGRGLHETTPYKTGQVEIQDLASQQIATAVAVQPGQKVWDTCAGAGGKSLAIASRMNNKGVVVATDLHAYKLDELKRRAKRADFSNIRTFTWDGQAPLRLPLEVARQKGFDWVLVDAPCTASGTWRRNPDARWRFDPSDCQELTALQYQLLEKAQFSVRAGGHLVYATCSWLAAENEDQVARFLQQHADFSLVEQRMLGLPRQNSDTMFVAVLKKSGL